MVSRNIVLKIIFNMMKNGSAVTFPVYIIKGMKYHKSVNERKKWELHQEIDQGTLKHYYGNSKLEQLLLVFLGNQEATGAKKKDRFFLDCTSISALRPPPPLGLSPFLHLFFLIFSKQLLH